MANKERNTWTLHASSTARHAPPTTRTHRADRQARRRRRRSIRRSCRADAARYQEITCRSALNPVKGMPFNWTLNPYRGCTHGCHYCFARRYQTQFELGPGDEFSSLIFVKVNFVDVLRRELDKPSWTREVVAVGTATDPYQPIEGHYKLTRRSLEALLAARTPVGHRHQGTDGRARHRPARGARAAEPAAPCASACRPSTKTRGARSNPARRIRCSGCAPCAAARGRHQRRRADGAGRARLHHPAGEARGDDQGDRRSRRRVHGRERHVLEGRHEGPLHATSRAASFPSWLEGYRRLYPGAYAPSAYVETVRADLIASLQRPLRRRAPGDARIAPRVGRGGARQRPPEEQTTFVWS